MQIAPSSSIKLCRGVPTTNNYNDVLWFPNATEAFLYFNSKVFASFEQCTYTKVDDKFVIRVPRKAEECYDANYLMFRNTNFGNKWFFAFITKVEYINNEVTGITYEIDLFQTWYYDCTVQPCFIHRMHSVQDPLFIHHPAEDITLEGKYVYDKRDFVPDGKKVGYIALLTTGTMSYNSFTSTYQYDPNDQGVAVKDGMLSLVQVTLYPNDDAHRNDLLNVLKAYNDASITNASPEDIITLMWCPGICVQPDASNQQPAVVTISDSKSNLISSAFGGYTPRNNRLYSYPYIKASVMCGERFQDYRFEDFVDPGNLNPQTNMTFSCYAVSTPMPSLIVIPNNHLGKTLDTEHSLLVNDFPTIPFTGDTFKMYINSHIGGDVIQLVGAATNAVISASMGNAIGTFIGIREAISETASVISGYMNAQMMPDKVYGMQSQNIFCNMSAYNPELDLVSLNDTEAKQVDDYFTQFGYAVNRVQQPSLHNRTAFTYVQTEKCKVLGNIPADAIKRIEKMFDDGVTAWVNPATVGDYTQTNNPLL